MIINFSKFYKTLIGTDFKFGKYRILLHTPPFLSIMMHKNKPKTVRDGAIKNTI